MAVDDKEMVRVEPAPATKFSGHVADTRPCAVSVAHDDATVTDTAKSPGASGVNTTAAAVELDSTKWPPVTLAGGRRDTDHRYCRRVVC